MSESFQIIFNSQGSNVLNNTNRNAVQYNVNWGSVLPQRYKKFKCNFTFRQLNYNGFFSDNGFASMDIGRINVYDGNSMSYNLGRLTPVYYSVNQVYYESTNNNNNEIWIDYPTNNIFTITLNSFSNVPMVNMPHYCLILNLVGIEDDDIPK